LVRYVPRQRRIFFVAVVLVAAAGCLVAPVSPGSSAQVPKEPDFSGEWVLARASGSTDEQASILAVRQSITRTTMRGEPMKPWFSELAVIERRYTRGVMSDKYRIGLIRGTVSGAPPGSEVRTTVAVKWEGEHLVIRTGKYSGPPQESGPYTEHEEVWSLDRKGRLLITVTDHGSNIKPTTVQLVYRRR
jgi:hypothetical protein